MAATVIAFRGRQRRLFRWFSSTRICHQDRLLQIAFLLLLFFVYTSAQQQLLQQPHHRPEENNSSDISRTGICKSIDIRSTLDTFDGLSGCRVVEGFVQVLLFDNVNETQLSEISFPQLTEITDYLLLYRVNGLRSVGQLFPNLSVIRGQNTFYGYSLVIFEMSSLTEIALYNLADVTKGLIRIDKNPSLCFIHSISWDLILHEKGDNFIKNLKSENECPICPGDEKYVKDDEFGDDRPQNSCPVRPRNNPSVDTYARNLHLCWNRQHCQKVCPKKCEGRSCNWKGECCHETCLGGCSDNDTTNCTVCRNLTVGFGANRTCVTHCPANYYKFLDRRCITRDECVNMRRPIDLYSLNDKEVKNPYKIFNSTCMLHCPVNYTDDGKNGCTPCDGRCRKDCPGVNIDSISLTKPLRGCTHIKGSLEIQIRGGNKVVNDLEENLSMIEEIDGYLKIVRSFPLVSLNFLKSLKRINGRQLESEKYSFIVLDNQNLQELWDDLPNRTLTISTGKLFFHFNPKLCLSKIRKLQISANLTSPTELEVATTSNGDKIACNVEKLIVNVSKIQNKGVVLTWKKFDMKGDFRKLLGYTVHSIEAPYRNITGIYDGRDACGGDGWRVDDVVIPDNETSELTHLLSRLKPYTQYAFYVKTYTIAEEKGAQSDLQYFRTLPSTPTKPLLVKVTSNASDAFLIQWQPPEKPNGNLTHYIVFGRRHEVRGDFTDRDNCNSVTNLHKNFPIPIPPVAPAPVPPPVNDTCSCEDNKPQSTSFDVPESESRIKFEDKLQNALYIKKTSVSRRKRDLPAELLYPKEEPPIRHSSSSDVKNITENGTTIWKQFNFKVFGKTELYITNLRHYAVYEIFVQACREREGGVEDKDDNCSSTSLQPARTLPKKGVDEVRNVRITNQSLEMVSVAWDEPPDPNGMIFSYTIQYNRLDHENSKPLYDCISHNHFLHNNRIHTLKKLQPGNYSLQVSVLTSAGPSDFTPYIYFVIKEPSSNTTLVIVLVLLTLFLIMVVIAYLVYRKKKADKENNRLNPSVNPVYVPSIYVPDEWEVPRKNIELMKELGQGSFGMVYEGIARDVKGKDYLKCAVKTVNEHATNRERLEFLNEASVMKAFDTAHVVRLLGVVSHGQPTLVIMELMANGDLKSYLRSHRPDADSFDSKFLKQAPTLRQILQMAIEISDGMAYLSAKKFVHRDLAARNCMVAEDLTVKIGDFGMTRDIYETDYYRKGTKGLLPVRWMAPESLKDGVFTSYSDVWSYGVVLWEMATLASQPYQGLSNDQVLRYVIDGGVMERPENCPDKLYALMRYCWQHKPTARPSFINICTLLIDDANNSFAKVSFYHSSAGVEARNSRITPFQSMDDPSTPLRIAEEFDGTYNSEDDLEINLGVESNPRLYPQSISSGADKDELATANGYIGGAPTNGAATTQC